MFSWFFKKKSIDDLISLYSENVSVKNNIRDKLLEIGIGSMIITHDYNYITMRSPIRISINKDYIIKKIEYNNYKLKNETIKILYKIKINSKFYTRYPILNENLKKLIDNFDDLGRYSETDICHKYIKNKDFDKNKLNFNKNFILF